MHEHRALRIIVLTNLYPPHIIGGYELACHDAVEGLRMLGHKVEVLTGTYGLEQPSVAEGIHRVLRILPFWRAGGWRADSRIVAAWWNVRSNLILRKLMHAVRPDVVYVWNMTGMPMSLLTTIQRTEIPIVFNVQDDWLLGQGRSDSWLVYWNRAPRNRAERAIRPALRRLTNFRVPTCYPRPRLGNAHYVSYAIAKRYAEKGCRFATERVIYNGIDLEHFTPHEQYLAKKPYQLLFLGQLYPWKGAHVAIDAVTLLTQQFGRDMIRLTVVGDSNDDAYKHRLRQMVSARGLEDVITFCGSVSRTETALIYRTHDIFLFPSSWQEGFSLALLEASACGLAVVGTTTGGSGEILQHEITGLTVEPENARELAAQTARLLDEPKLIKELGEMAASTVRARFDQHNIIRQVEEYLLTISARLDSK